MLSGAAGDWLFRSPYTAYPQTGLLMFLPYLLLGKLAAPPGMHEQLVSLYHLYRIVAGMLAIFASYDFLAYFIWDVRLRRFGLALASLGGGLGWLLALLGRENWLGSLPLDFYSPEAFGFLGLFGLPHLALARALLLWALLAYLRLAANYAESHQPKASHGAQTWLLALQLSCLWSLAGVFQPLTLVVIGVVIGVHQVGWLAWRVFRRPHGQAVQWGEWRGLVGWLLAAGILPAIFVAYNLGITFFDPYARLWTAQNVIRSPHILHYLAAYGLLLPFAWVGGWRWLRKDARRGWLLVGWVAIFPILAYAPLDLQRRLTEGVWLAWCALAVSAFEPPSEEAVTVAPRRLDWRFAPLWLAFLSTVFLLIGGMLAAINPAPPVFRPLEQTRIFEVLAEKARPGQVVLGAFDDSNALPAWAALRVVVGHGPESVHQAELKPQIAAFYQPQTLDNQRLALLNRFEIAYVLWGPAERLLGDWRPSEANYLKLMEQHGDYALYQVVIAP